MRNFAPSTKTRPGRQSSHKHRGNTVTARKFPILQLQYAIGNKAVYRLLKTGAGGTLIQRDEPGNTPAQGLSDFEKFQEHLSKQRIYEALDLLKKQDIKIILDWLSKLSTRELTVLMSASLEPRLMTILELVYFVRFEPDLDTVKRIIDSLAGLQSGDISEIDGYLKRDSRIGAVRIRRLKAAVPQFWSSRTSFMQKARSQFPTCMNFTRSKKRL